jgi:hypothetical protein
MTEVTSKESSSRITFDRICELDHEVRVLFEDAKRAGDEDKYFDGIAAWFGEHGYERYSFKQRLCDLVGWSRHREPVELQSSEAYDVAYKTIFDAMPPDREDPADGEPST